MFRVGKVIGLLAVLLLFAILVPLALAQGNQVEVGLTEFQINMPNSIPAGQTSFVVTNNGTVPHSFAIEGQGIDQALGANLQPGETQTLQVNLEPGTYNVYCPVDGHRGQGMELQLTVTAQGAVQTTPEATATSGALEATSAATETVATATTAAGAAAATPTPQAAVLPQTGGEIWPWSSILLLAAGSLVLLGGLSLAWMRRTR